MASSSPALMMEYWAFPEHYTERRQLFLRSYHFSRKPTALEQLRRSAVRVRRLVWLPLRSAGRLPRLLWAGLRAGLAGRRRRPRHRFIRVTACPPRPCSGDLNGDAD